MPEIGEQMYCSQQICIPPTFPYLLRQFAKAAIRTQPNDLLKWSTTYFRCLSLNIPPPVKPRLEYPIPRDFYGLTPGWLRALLHQIQDQPTVSFKTLWDRWIGACLQHTNLIQILCLGGFDNNKAIPWLRFVGICAAHLTENLTESMVLICEILTDEPEGGSAMIPVGIFLDLYKFLARIDASIPKTLKNYHFMDKFLELFQQKFSKAAKTKEDEEMAGDTETSETSSATTLDDQSKRKRDDGTSAISCPSVSSQDPDNFMKLLIKIQEGDVEGEEEEFESKPAEEDDSKAPADSESQKEETDSDKETEQISPKSSESLKSPSHFSEQLVKDMQVAAHDDTASQATIASTSKEPEAEEKQTDDANNELLQDLERLKVVQQELYGETDDELEKFKASILADMPLTESQMEAPQHFEKKLTSESSEVLLSDSVKSELLSASDESSEDKKAEEEEPEYELVNVDAIAGIGGKVPEDLIEAVCAYIGNVGKLQHNMVMPRNLQHYECPPLEILDI